MNAHDEAEDDTPIAGLQQLSREVEPARDLWPGIAPRLKPRRRLGANGWMSLAAAACVAAVVGLAVLRPAPTSSPAGASAATPEVAYAPDLTAVPGSRALVKANLQLSRDYEQQIRRALRQDPHSASLRRLLLTTQQSNDELHRMLVAQAT
ncbi:hypothetical protein [Solimonas marina]|uniref:Uncharacterized protein n=1 Tax=Solimonas marina TaxID=2714601 RepID=A0A970B9Y4_9GAMM|nr:hypothetical protein [Solimonas marina]NKF23829.1 hypothetical protein [Solimonas marina]